MLCVECEGLHTAAQRTRPYRDNSYPAWVLVEHAMQIGTAATPHTNVFDCPRRMRNF
jgi:hypothetical protein